MLSIWTILLILAALLSAGWFWIKCVVPAYRRAREYSLKVSTCGYLADPPSPGWVRFLQRFAACVTAMQAGPIKVVGAENLPAQVPGDLDKQEPFMVCPNHPHYVDPGVMVRVLNRPVRFMAAQGVFTCGHGFGALLAGPCGAFAVDLTPGKGTPARDAAVKVLTTHQVLCMFPEGWAYLDGQMGRLHKGAVWIAKKAADELGKPVSIIPVFLRYGCYPGSWIKKLPPPIQYYWMYVNKWYYRRGVTVVIGKPISSSELPTDDAEGTELLRQRIVGLDPQPPKS
jgi:1-acyl-sn-glycerol-3-phosphate acyltransferase